MSPALIAAAVVLSVVVVGIVLRTLRGVDDPGLPDDDDAGYQQARGIVKKNHEVRTEKIEQILKKDEPEEGLADAINLDGGPL